MGKFEKKVMVGAGQGGRSRKGLRRAFVLPRLGVILAAGTVGQIIDATIGAVIVLVILSLIRRA